MIVISSSQEEPLDAGLIGSDQVVSDPSPTCQSRQTKKILAQRRDKRSAVLYLRSDQPRPKLRSLLPPASTAALPPDHGLVHHASGDGDRSARAGSQETAGKEVAVIGAGAAGLAAGRELRREGHRFVVFERGNTVGGTWVYTPEVESPDLLGLDPNRTLVHSSVYESLRTNLPRDVMGFLDYPFSARPGCDGRRFPSHQEVAAYLADFAADFDLVRWIRFETEVVNVVQHPDGRWLVRSRRALLNSECTPPSAAVIEEVFDAVVVCNGHYTERRLAVIPGVTV